MCSKIMDTDCTRNFVWAVFLGCNVYVWRKNNLGCCFLVSEGIRYLRDNRISKFANPCQIKLFTLMFSCTPTGNYVTKIFFWLLKSIIEESKTSSWRQLCPRRICWFTCMIERFRELVALRICFKKFWCKMGTGKIDKEKLCAGITEFFPRNDNNLLLLLCLLTFWCSGLLHTVSWSDGHRSCYQWKNAFFGVRTKEAATILQKGMKESLRPCLYLACTRQSQDTKESHMLSLTFPGLLLNQKSPAGVRVPQVDQPMC